MKFGDERPDECMRITTFVEAMNHFEVDSIAEERFEEALDVLATQNAFARYGLLPSGCFYWPDAGRVLPRELGAPARPGGMSFHVPRDEFPRMDWPQFLLARAPNDLSQRLLRSYHWSNKAELDANRQLRVLFRWFAMEAIWMVSKDHDIVPSIMWSLGFPMGPGAGLLSPALSTVLKSHPTYGAWRSQILHLLYRAKTLRNDSVHSGFRRQDVPKTVLNDLTRITALACPRVQRQASAGMSAQLASAVELFEYLPLLVDGDPSYVATAHNTVIFSLENPFHARWLG
jgi:hypothetical protein